MRVTLGFTYIVNKKAQFCIYIYIILRGYFIPFYRLDTCTVFDPSKDRIILSGGLFQIFTATRPKLCTFFMLTTLATEIFKAFKAVAVRDWVGRLGKSCLLLILNTP
jgi:hypothetical protein